MKDMHSNYRDRLVEEAADWFARLQDAEISAEDRTAFADWLSASPEHVREYLALTTLHTDVGELPATQSVDDLIRLATHPDEGRVVHWPFGSRFAPLKHSEATAVRTSREGRGAHRWLAVAASIALVAVVAATWWMLPNANDAIYSTAVGEQESFPLPDGSVVTLNAVSRLHVRFTEQYRDIELLSGEAFFTVTSNARRPFRVMTNGAVIQAVGTRFNVYHRHADTTVTVVEGIIEIRNARDARPIELRSSTTSNPSPPVRVVHGQRARIDPQDAAVSIKLVDPALDTAWRERRLVFESRRLEEVVAEFNLYNEAPLEIGDPALNDIHVSGSFYANDPRSFAAFLHEARLARMEVHSGQIVLQPALVPP